MERIFLQKFAPPFEINLTQFNFDPSELKKGEGSFKTELTKSLSSPDENTFKPMFKDFAFTGKNLKAKTAKGSERRVNSASNATQLGQTKG